MKVLGLLQVLLLAASSSWQVEAHSGEQKTAVQYSSNTTNQTFNLPFDAIGIVSRSVGKGTTAHNKGTTNEKIAIKRAPRQIVDTVESPQVNTELSNTSDIMEFLENSSRGIGHIEDLSISASPTNTAAAIAAFPVTVSPGLADIPLIKSETIVYLDDATTSALKSDEASRWTRNVTGDTTHAENGSDQSAAHEAAITLTATVTLADVTSQATDNVVNGDRNTVDHPPLAIIIAAGAGGAAALTVLLTVVWLLCHYRRRRIERKKLKISQQEPRLSVLWPQALQRESSLVPRYDHIRTPREQPIEMVENDQRSAITRNPLFHSFNDEAS